MNDNEISILIKAVDEATAILNGIKNSVETTADKSTQANEKMGMSFDKVQGAMLNLGQIAQGVHSIFEIGERRTLALQNAQDRLENATIRLGQAQDNLAAAEQKVNDIEQNHARDSLTLEGAQLSVESATRDLAETTAKYGDTALETRQASLRLKEAQADLTDAQVLGTKKSDELSAASADIAKKQDQLTISQNQVQVATNRLTMATSNANWMYLDMGVQIVSVIGNLGTFFNTMKSVTVATEGATVATGGLTASFGAQGLAGMIGAAGPFAIAAGAAIGLFMAIKSQIDDEDKAIDLEKTKWEALTGQILNATQAKQAYYYDQSKKMQQQNMDQTISNYGVNTPDYLQNVTVNPGLITGNQTTVNAGLQNDWLVNPWKNLNIQVDTAKSKIIDFNNTVTSNSKTINFAIDSTGNLIGSNKKGSYPIVYSLGLAQDKWDEMTKTSVGDIQQINDAINTIPSDIYTYHHIITIYD